MVCGVLRDIAQAWRRCTRRRFGGPVGEPLQLVAVLPGQLKEFGSGHVSGFLAQEGLKPPL